MGRNWLCSCFEATPVVVQAISTTSDHRVNDAIVNEADDLGTVGQEHGFAHPIDEWMPESAIADVGSELDTINEQGESQCTTLTDARSASKHTSSFLPQPDEFSEALSNPRTVGPAKHWYVNPDYGSIWRLKDSGEQIVFAMDPLRPIPFRHQLPSGSSSTKWPAHQRLHAQQVNSPSIASATESSTAYSSVQSEDLSLRATTEPEPHWTLDRPYPASESQPAPPQPLQTRSSYGEHSVLAMPSEVHPMESEGSTSESSPVSADYNFFTSPPMASSMRQTQEVAMLDRHREYHMHRDATGNPPRHRSCNASSGCLLQHSTGHSRHDSMTDDVGEADSDVHKWPEQHHDISVHYRLQQRPPSILNWPDADGWGGSVAVTRSDRKSKGHVEESGVRQDSAALPGSKFGFDHIPADMHGGQTDEQRFTGDRGHRHGRHARIRATLT